MAHNGVAHCCNTCIIIFVYGDGMDSSCASMVCQEGFFYTFNHFQQTNWNNETCDLQSKVFDPNVNFFLMNHWMSKPETDLTWEGNAEEFNRYDLLSSRFRLCTACTPNIIAVNFWSDRDVLDFVTEVNRNRAGRGGGGTMAEIMPWIKGGK
jgi:hypothetical protein